MKNIIKIFIFGVLLLSLGCEQDDTAGTKSTINNNGELINADHISVHDLLDFLPDGYMNRVDLIYKDQSGSEKKLKTAFIEGQRERTEYGRKYTYDNFVVRLFSEDDPDFLIEIDGYGLYRQTGEVQKVIATILMPRNPKGSSGVPVIFENGKPTVTMFDKFHESTTILGRTFEKVYFGNSWLTQYDAYSEVYFNFTEGVVAFRDAENKLWVFDRFEE